MIRKIKYPPVDSWDELSMRPALPQDDLEQAVRTILEKVRTGSDAALRELSITFDGTDPGNLKVSEDEIQSAAEKVPADLKNAIETAKDNIWKFHQSQLIEEPVTETAKGVRCWRKSVAIEKVGLYIPGGSAPLFSTLLMLAIPARIAGCKQVIACTPPARDGSVNPVILYTASLLGITDVFKVGGAQAIAAMAYGTKTVPAVYKIFGPGNQYVTKAKEIVQLEGLGIDMPAGPSEVLVIADSNANPGFVAADLLSQAEHGSDSQVMLLTDSEELCDKVLTETERQLNLLPRKSIAEKALSHSRAIILRSITDCISFSNIYAPEHLIINVNSPESLISHITNAGSVFLGQYSCESAGDYASGTNHTLPTSGFARLYSGVSVDSFVKKITFQELSADGIKQIGNAIELMADAESLTAHKNAVTVRLKSLPND